MALINRRKLVTQLVQTGILKSREQNITLGRRGDTKLQADKALLEQVLQATEFLSPEAVVKERLLCLASNIVKQSQCESCSKPLRMSLTGVRYGTYSKFCGSKCFAGNKEVISKRAETNLTKYGTKNVFASDQIKTKIKTSMLEKYGVDNAAKLESSKVKRKITIEQEYGSIEQFNKVRTERTKQTCNDKYGSDSPMKNTEVQEKQRKTVQERYGVDNVFKSSEIQEYARARHVEVHGVEYPLQSPEIVEKFKKTMVEKYGHEHYHTSQLPGVVILLSDRTWLYEQYYTKKRTIAMISNELGVEATIVYKYLKQHGIPTNCEPDTTE